MLAGTTVKKFALSDGEIFESIEDDVKLVFGYLDPANRIEWGITVFKKQSGNQWVERGFFTGRHIAFITYMDNIKEGD